MPKKHRPPVFHSHGSFVWLPCYMSWFEFLSEINDFWKWGTILNIYGVLFPIYSLNHTAYIIWLCHQNGVWFCKSMRNCSPRKTENVPQAAFRESSSTPVYFRIWQTAHQIRKTVRWRKRQIPVCRVHVKPWLVEICRTRKGRCRGNVLQFTFNVVWSAKRLSPSSEMIPFDLNSYIMFSLRLQVISSTFNFFR